MTYCVDMGVLGEVEEFRVSCVLAHTFFVLIMLVQSISVSLCK